MYSQSVDQIMQKAVDIEREGADFYRKLAGEVSTEAVKSVLLGFVADEVRHQKDFSALAKMMTGVVIESSLDILEVMNVAVTKLRQTMKGSELVDMGEVDLAQAIKIGIYNEKEAIRIYSSLLEIDHAKLGIVIKRIIAEEGRHLLALENMKRARLG